MKSKYYGEIKIFSLLPNFLVLQSVSFPLSSELCLKNLMLAHGFAIVRTHKFIHLPQNLPCWPQECP